MATITLSQSVVDGLVCPQGKKKIEFVDSNRTGLYVSVTASTAYYYLRYKNNGKTTHVKLGPTSTMRLSAARQKVKLLRADIAAGKYSEEASVPTFKEFFTNSYLPYAKSRIKSWNKTESLFRCHLRGEFGNLKLDQISRSHAEAFHRSLVEVKGLSPAQADHAIKVLKTTLFYACHHSVIMKNPIARFRLFNAPNVVNNILTEEELNRFIKVLKTHKNRMTCLVILWLLSTGARLNSALNCRWIDINRSSRTWVIPIEYAKNKRLASIPLNDSAIAVLDQLGTEGQYEHLFINHKSGTRLKSIHTGFKALREEAGITNFRLHDCRHQFASHCINQGRSLYEVSKLLTQSTISQTARYSHLSTKILREAAQCASLPLSDE